MKSKKKFPKTPEKKNFPHFPLQFFVPSFFLFLFVKGRIVQQGMFRLNKNLTNNNCWRRCIKYHNRDTFQDLSKLMWTTSNCVVKRSEQCTDVKLRRQ